MGRLFYLKDARFVIHPCTRGDKNSGKYNFYYSFTIASLKLGRQRCRRAFAVVPREHQGDCISRVHEGFVARQILKHHRLSGVERGLGANYREYYESSRGKRSRHKGGIFAHAPPSKLENIHESVNDDVNVDDDSGDQQSSLRQNVN